MTNPIVYVDHAAIRDGKFEELKAAMNELVDFVKTNEPQLIAYNVYFHEDSARMTVIHIHRSSASLEFHMKVAGPLFAKFAELITLLTIDVYGQPSDHLVQQLRQKARMLGNGTVLVHGPHAGFAHFPIQG